MYQKIICKNCGAVHETDFEISHCLNCGVGLNGQATKKFTNTSLFCDEVNQVEQVNKIDVVEKSYPTEKITIAEKIDRANEVEQVVEQVAEKVEQVVEPIINQVEEKNDILNFLDSLDTPKKNSDDEIDYSDDLEFLETLEQPQAKILV